MINFFFEQFNYVFFWWIVLMLWCRYYIQTMGNLIFWWLIFFNYDQFLFCVPWIFLVALGRYHIETLGDICGDFNWQVCPSLCQHRYDAFRVGVHMQGSLCTHVCCSMFCSVWYSVLQGVLWGAGWHVCTYKRKLIGCLNLQDSFCTSALGAWRRGAQRCHAPLYGKNCVLSTMHRF